MAKRLSRAESDRGLPRSESALLAWVMVGSLLCHIAVLALLIWVPGLRMQRLNLPGAINVDLVSLSAPGPAGGAKKGPRQPLVKPKVEKPAVKPAAQKQEVETAPAPKETVETPVKKVEKKPPPPKKPAPVEEKIAVAVKPKEPKPAVSEPPKVKTPPKKQSPPSDSVKQAIERIQKTVDRTASRSDSLQKALAKLKQEVKKASDEGRVRDRSPDAAGSEGTGEAGGGGGGGGDGAVELIDIYRVEIAHRVQSNWAYSSQLGDGGSAQRVALVFKVFPNGEISDIFFTERSGNHYLDDSALKAVEKSNPLPPYPVGLVRPYVEVGLRFSPQGVQ
jgi:colicin import membrane protein